MTKTDKLLAEIERCKAAMLKYKKNSGDGYQSRTHAAAKRASMDLTMALSEWRKELPSTWQKGGGPK